MATITDVFTAVVPFLPTADAGALASALSQVSRAHRGVAAGVAAAGASHASSAAWHAAVEGIVGVEEYALLVSACRGGLDPYEIVDAPPAVIDDAVSGALRR
jgi:hypothetical protein